MSGKVLTVSAAADNCHNLTVRVQTCLKFPHLCWERVSDHQFGKGWLTSAQNYVRSNYASGIVNVKIKTNVGCPCIIQPGEVCGNQKPVTDKQAVVYKAWIREEPKGSVRQKNRQCQYFLVQNPSLRSTFEFLWIQMNHKRSHFEQTEDRNKKTSCTECLKFIHFVQINQSCINRSPTSTDPAKVHPVRGIWVYRASRRLQYIHSELAKYSVLFLVCLELSPTKANTGLK